MMKKVITLKTTHVMKNLDRLTNRKGSIYGFIFTDMVIMMTTLAILVFLWLR